MGVNVKINCDWNLQVTLEGGEGTVVPDEWVIVKGADPITAGRTLIDLYFKDEASQDQYNESAIVARSAAEKEYAKTFYKVMNSERERVKKG